jgi:hypothetical protein
MIPQDEVHAEGRTQAIEYWLQLLQRVCVVDNVSRQNDHIRTLFGNPIRCQTIKGV